MSVKRVIQQADMLPLIDVILVVLFVFATIEEGNTQNQSSSVQMKEQQIDNLQSLLNQLQSQLDEMIPAETLESALASKDETIDAQKKTAAQQAQTVAELKKTIQDQKTDLKRSDQKTKDILKFKLKVSDQRLDLESVKRAESLIKHLLKQNIVTEVEISGEDNTCCYRQDPQKGSWQSCGQVPIYPNKTWLKGPDAQKLNNTLESTRGGNAITIVRQDVNASHLISVRLQSVIRQEISESKVYVDDASPLPKAKCSDYKANPFLIP